MINFKQEELIKKLVKDVQKQYPEVKFINVTTSPEDPNHLWVRITAPEDEDREIELREFGANKTMDILLDYGYHISLKSTSTPEHALIGYSYELSLDEG